MALHNINLLQNPIDIKEKISFAQNSDNSYTFSLGDKYLIQSLANLGQRNGIKGDSIIYNTFNFYDVFKNYPNKSADENIGRIKIINDNKCEFSIINKSTLKPDDNFPSEIIPTENIINIKNNILSSIIINNIDLYSKKSSLVYKDHKFITMLFGKIAGTKEDDENNQEIIYNIFDTQKNELEFAVRTYWLYNDNVTNYYLMFTVERDNNSTTEINAVNYKMRTYLFNSSLLNKEKQIDFENAFKFSESYNNIFINNLSDNILNTDKLFNYLDDEDASLFGLIKYYELNNELNKIDEDINLIYNSSTNEKFSILNIVSESLKSIYNKNISLNNRIDFLNNDLIYFYPKLLEYYSNVSFKNDKYSAYKAILYNIYKYIESFKLNNEKNYSLYVPLNYIFTYTCNSNDELNIYNSKDIFITLTENASDLFNQEKTLIYNYDGIDKIKNICFNVNYNNKYSDYMSNIDILDIYTLPYISDAFTWNINDTNTNISVLGKNAGNPNIIMLYNYKDENNEIKYNILSGANIEEVNNAEFTENYFQINPKSNLLDDTIKNNNNICKCKIPVITKKNKDLFKYSLLIVLADKSCLDIKDTTSQNNLSDIFTSLWKVSSDTDNSQFKYISSNELNDKDNSMYALDISYLLNIKNIISTYINNAYKHVNSLKFENIFINASNNILNNNDSEHIGNCAIINNESPSDYKNNLLRIFTNTDKSKFESKFDYNNQLNLNLKYGKNVNAGKYATDDFYQDDKFITNSKFKNVTNTLYPIYNKSYIGIHDFIASDDFNKSANTYNMIYTNNYKYKLSLASREKKRYSLNQTEELKSNIHNDIYDVSIEHIKVPIHNINLEEYKFGEKDENGNIKYFYNEYLPNENVPILDNKEILLANNNTLNRINILSIDKNGCTYNSYIGSRFDINSKKNVFTIGSSTTNINLGSTTLFNHDNINNLIEQKQIDINFNDINLNGNTKIKNAVEINLNPLKLYNINKTDVHVLNTELCGQLGDDLETILIDNKNNFRCKNNGFEKIINSEKNYNEIIDPVTKLPKENYICNISINSNINNNLDKLFYNSKIIEKTNNIPCLIYINLNLLLNPYLNKIFNSNLENNNFIFEYNINNDPSSVETANISMHPKILNIKNTYLLELSCNNYGTLSKYFTTNNKIHMVTDNIKFIFYENESNKYIKYISINKPFIDEYNK